VARWSASNTAGSTILNGQNALGVDVLKGVPETQGFFNGRVPLVSDLLVFMLQVCDQQVEFSFVHLVLQIQ